MFNTGHKVKYIFYVSRIIFALRFYISSISEYHMVANP